MAKVVWSEEALDWMQLIDSYLGEVSPQAAVRTLEGILQQVEMLGDHPRIGGRLPKWDPREVRSKLYGKYQIIYEVDADDGVRVLAVIHGAMDIRRMRF
ncbi:type II toxin-antitoxin system RelE/ParE family toxin [Botrimarina mediterranea]|uniref:Plasmid stabilization system protein n=1 Tax=Botrimarina mediterranea TaxID=2528022 RepID=A0A518KDC7_9BACT|nr:type II toxin-antitoxin system RelE/ParE family toxin [Botrimarina mediterranea]QDV75805.1 Plasmid stabilization system protein [Botrimarina mediterranea]